MEKVKLDDIFQKSNMSEEKRESKRLLGRLLIALRKANHINLYGLLESAVDSDLIDETLIILLNDKTSFDILSIKENISVLEEQLQTIGKKMKVEFKFVGIEELDVYKFETFLKEEFGKILSIKK